MREKTSREKLITIKEVLKLTQKEIALTLKTSKQNVNRWLLGVYEPTAAFKEQITKLYNIALKQIK